MAEDDPTESPEQGRPGKIFRSVLGWNEESPFSFLRKPSSEVGAIESLVWFGGLVALKYIVAYVVSLLPEILQRLFPVKGPVTNQPLASDGIEGFWDQYAPLLVAEILIEGVVVVLCIWLRLGRPKLQWHRPRFTTAQFCLFLAGTAPVATLAAFIYDWVRAIGIASGVSWYAVDPWSGIELLLTYFSRPSAIALYAAVPAIVEELVFRRLIGQGLVSRLGTTGGILLTSALFGLSHWHLPHVASTFVMGLFLHLTYLKTRSLLAPILVHFANNTVWLVLTKNSMERDGVDWRWDFDSPFGSPSFLCGGFAFVASAVTALALSATSPRELADDGATVENAGNSATCPAWLFVLATVGNVAVCGLWIHEFLRLPRFQ